MKEISDERIIESFRENHGYDSSRFSNNDFKVVSVVPEISLEALEDANIKLVITKRKRIIVGICGCHEKEITDNLVDDFLERNSEQLTIRALDEDNCSLHLSSLDGSGVNISYLISGKKPERFPKLPVKKDNKITPIYFFA